MAADATKSPPAASTRRPRDASISTGHLREPALRDDEPKPGKPAPPRSEDEGDWKKFDEGEGDRSRPAATNDEHEFENENPPGVPAVPKLEMPTMTEFDPMAFMAFMEQVSAQKDSALAAFDAGISAKDDAIKVMQEEREALVAQRDRFAIMVGAPALSKPAASSEPAPAPVKRRGGRRTRRGVPADGSAPAAAPAATATAEPGVSTKRTGKGSRPRNDKTLKEAIKEVLGKKDRMKLNDISAEILKGGFKTSAEKFPNTVRVQLYRLDDDGEVTMYDDGTFSLKK